VDQLALAGYVQCGVEGAQFSTGDLARSGDRFAAGSKRAAKSFELGGRESGTVRRREPPLMEEERQPGRIPEPVRALAVGIPFLAVDEVDPGSGLAVAFFPELVGRQRHSNAINTFDSLQNMGYPG